MLEFGVVRQVATTEPSVKEPETLRKVGVPFEELDAGVDTSVGAAHVMVFEPRVPTKDTTFALPPALLLAKKRTVEPSADIRASPLTNDSVPDVKTACAVPHVATPAVISAVNE